MTDNTDTSAEHPSFLLRWVKMPHALQILVLAAMLYAVIDLARNHPLLLMGALGGGVLLGNVATKPLLRRARMVASSNNPSASLWDMFRTYQVWHLVLLICALVMLLTDVLGIINF